MTLRTRSLCGHGRLEMTMLGIDSLLDKIDLTATGWTATHRLAQHGGFLARQRPVRASTAVPGSVTPALQTLECWSRCAQRSGAGWVTVKVAWLMAVPAGVVTVMRPVAAPAGTLVRILVAVC